MTKLVISASTFQSQVADLLPCNNFKKSQLTYSLIQAYNLFDYFDVIIRKPFCSKEDMIRFHSRPYIEQMMQAKLNGIQEYDHMEDNWNQLNEVSEAWYRANDEETPRETRFSSREKLLEYFKEIVESKCDESDSDDDKHVQKKMKPSNPDQEMLNEFNFTGDCPLFSFLPMYLQVCTGATLSLARELPPPSSENFERAIQINWDGGRHHASKNHASGFCYINDIVLLIQELRKKGFQRVSYIDFDLHHGDGVQNAFKYSNLIQTISLHLYESGFFPGTGSLQENKAPGLVNIPMMHGLNDKYLYVILLKIIIPLVDKHNPQVIIIQSGGDGLLGDKYDEWQLSIRGLAHSIMRIVNKFTDSHVIILGGGGYNELIMSRFNTYLTWQIVKRYSSFANIQQTKDFISNDFDCLIPEHEFSELYAEDNYKYWIYEQPGSIRNRTLRDNNTPAMIKQCISTIRDALN
ncbi:hypothetical protein C6P45_004550 [Maudiozyma exigua]|uniref:histone deacetylase n=1 Tax=Maudiozyma exigua TaxID=34358 RepID=A0A9P7BBN2_MAUEX|nr:hypothetical protein C6P45_004550 [Kazachstania exigua]